LTPLPRRGEGSKTAPSASNPSPPERGRGEQEGRECLELAGGAPCPSPHTQSRRGPRGLGARAAGGHTGGSHTTEGRRPKNSSPATSRTSTSAPSATSTTARPP